MIIIIVRGENFVAHLDGLGGTPVAHHWSIATIKAIYTSVYVSIYRKNKVEAKPL
jgi:hypothetical protein